MQDLNKLVEVAIDYRIATLKAREQGLLNISYVGTDLESFQYYDEMEFAEIIKNKFYTVKKFNSGMYEYTVVIDGLTFFCLSHNLLFDGDEERIEVEQ